MNRDNDLLLAAAETIDAEDPIGAFRGLKNALAIQLIVGFGVFLGWMLVQWWAA